MASQITDIQKKPQFILGLLKDINLTLNEKDESQDIFDVYTLIEKETNKFIGWSGIKLLTDEVNGYKNVYELGYRFLPDFWGKGYATESAKASLDLGFNQLNADTIYAYADVENQSSNYILTKLGFENKGTFLDEGDICNWYELEKK